MTTLRGKIFLACLKKTPPLSVFEICRMMQPYLAHYQLQLKEGEICFPEELSESQRMLLSLYAPDVYQKGIPFQRILFIREDDAGIEVFLRTGHVFLFWKDDILWDIYNVYSFGEPDKIQTWYWIASENVACCWRYIRNFLGGHR